MNLSVNEKRKIEIEFWRDNEHERPGAESLDNQLDKSADALILREAIRPFKDDFATAKNIVELGAGQGWASCIVKRLFPNCNVTATDISKFAVESINRWEKIYGVTIDSTAACTSDELPFEDNSIDIVFCFAAAHHFVTHRETFKELNRVLKPGGAVFYLFEPASPKWLYAAAVRRVNNKRPDVPEDVLVPSCLCEEAKKQGFGTEVHYWPTTLKRSRGASIYFGILGYLPFLCRLVPCTANFVFRKPN